MATVFTHALVAGALGQGMNPELRKNWRFWTMAALCAMIPDADVIGFRFGVHYGDWWGHRGMTHSLLFAVVLGGLVSLRFYSVVKEKAARIRLAIFFAVVTASHGVLDALTNGGLGVAFFSPFDRTRYFFPWQPIEVSPIGASFFSARGLAVIANEVVWIVAPAFLIGLILRYASKGGRHG